MRLAIAALFCLVGSHLSAAELTTEKSAVFAKSPAEIISVLTDYENTCDSGCKYTVKGLEETKVISEVEGRHVVWQQLKAAKVEKQFVINTITNNEDGSITFLTGYPSAAEIETLKAQTGLVHETSFSALSTAWKLTPSSTGETTVSVKMFVNHSYPALANGFIKKALDQAIEGSFKNLALEPTVP